MAWHDGSFTCDESINIYIYYVLRGEGRGDGYGQMKFPIGRKKAGSVSDEQDEWGQKP